jgi:ATP-binding cassette subfamily B (MDR/TAP) protein 9
VQASLLAYGAFLIQSPEVQMHPKILLAFMLYQGQLQEYFQNLLNSFTSLIKSSGAAAKVFEFIDRVPAYHGDANRTVVTATIAGGGAPEPLPEKPVGGRSSGGEDGGGGAAAEEENGAKAMVGMDVVFRDVQFSYPARPEAAVLRGLSFQASVGEVVALVGSSGSGKSTCFHLLEHFYEPQIGEVLLNGKPAAEIDHSWLHRNVALVGQEPTLLSGTIEDNVTYGLKDFGVAPSGRDLYAAMVQAAREANAHDFITRLPNGYQTEVGERGVRMWPLQCSPLVSHEHRLSTAANLRLLWEHRFNCRAGRSKELPLRDVSSGTRRSCCSTRPRVPWTLRVRPWCKRLSSGPWLTGPRC